MQLERPAQSADRRNTSAEEAAQWRPASAAGFTDLSGDPDGGNWFDPKRGPPPKGVPIRLEADWFFSPAYMARISQ